MKAMYDAQGTTCKGVITRYFKSNPKWVDYWVTGEQ